MRHQHFVFSALLIPLLSAILMLSPLSARQTQAAEKMHPGTYLITQGDGYLVLLTLAPDGNAFGQQTGQFEPPTAFGDQQGSWKMTSNGTILIRTLDFIRDTKTGAFTGFGRCLYTAKFKPDGTLTGKFIAEIFPPNADPLDLRSSNPPTHTFGPIDFTGRRLTVK